MDGVSELTPINVGDPTQDTEAATKKYVDEHAGSITEYTTPADLRPFDVDVVTEKSLVTLSAKITISYYYIGTSETITKTYIVTGTAQTYASGKIENSDGLSVYEKDTYDAVTPFISVTISNGFWRFVFNGRVTVTSFTVDSYTAGYIDSAQITPGYELSKHAKLTFTSNMALYDVLYWYGVNSSGEFGQLLGGLPQDKYYIGNGTTIILTRTESKVYGATSAQVYYTGWIPVDGGTPIYVVINPTDTENSFIEVSGVVNIEGSAPGTAFIPSYKKKIPAFSIQYLA